MSPDAPEIYTPGGLLTMESVVDMETFANIHCIYLSICG